MTVSLHGVVFHIEGDLFSIVVGNSTETSLFISYFCLEYSYTSSDLVAVSYVCEVVSQVLVQQRQTRHQIEHLHTVS